MQPEFFSIRRFVPELTTNHEEPGNTLSLAAQGAKLTVRVERYSMSKPLVITRVTVFDSLSGSHCLNQTVMISDGRIADVCNASTPTEHPQGALVIDGLGMFPIPGLIDAHVHLVHQLKPANMTGSEILPYFLTASVTSVRDIGDFTLEQAAVAHYAETYPHATPRLFLATDALDGADPFHSDLGTPVAHRAQVAGVIAKMVGDMEGRRIRTAKLYAPEHQQYK